MNISQDTKKERTCARTCVCVCVCAAGLGKHHEVFLKGTLFVVREIKGKLGSRKQETNPHDAFGKGTVG